MGTKSLGQLEKHAYFILFMATILVLFWHGVWGIADMLGDHIEHNHNIRKLHYHIATIFLVVLIIGLFPKILEKL
jgi:succinate dehydrogenase hydrophobic anchor subunit